MPLNLLDAHYRSFEKAVFPVCREKGIGVLGMKSLAGQDARLPRDVAVDSELCRRYAMSLPVSDHHLRHAEPARSCGGMVRIARGFTPLTTADVDRSLGVSRGRRRDGHIEEYKDPKSGYGCSYQDAVLKSGA